jgi:hypothetical protein
MPLAQVIRFDERQAIGRPRRALEKQSACIVLQFPPACPATPAKPSKVCHDDDRAAGRGRDPG